MTPYIFAGLNIFDKRNYIKLRNTTDVDRILFIVARHFNISESAITSQNRYRSLTFPRQLAIYLIRTKLNLTLVEISKIFVRDHSTIIYSIDALEGFIAYDKNAKRTLEQLEFIYESKRLS